MRKGRGRQLLMLREALVWSRQEAEEVRRLQEFAARVGAEPAVAPEEVSAQLEKARFADEWCRIRSWFLMSLAVGLFLIAGVILVLGW